MLDMNWLNNSVWRKRVTDAELFQSTGRATGGQYFIKLHFNPPSFPVLVMAPFTLDLAWIQLGHPVFLTEDGTAWRPCPDRPKITEGASWLEGREVELRLELKDFSTRWRGEKTYVAPRFLKLVEPVNV